MVITVTCPACSSSFPVDPAKIPEGGVNARCTSCGDIFRIEKPVEVEPVSTFAELAPDPPVEATPPPMPPAPPIPVPPVVAEPAPPVVEAPVVDEPAAPVVESPDDWVMENEEVPAMEPDSLPDVHEPVPAMAEPESVEPAVAEPEIAPEVQPEAAEPEVAAAPTEAVSDPFAEPAPFEQAEPEVAESLPAPAELEEPTAAPTEEAAAGGAATPGVQGFTFGKRDPTDKAKRLARVLVSDMIMYNAERHQNALGAGTILQDFEEEIDKSWKEFVEQVGEELADGPGREFWTEALNDILAKGEKIF